MLTSIILLIVGLAILVGGADLLVRGVSALAEALGAPPIIIGMTVVAFGTSTPELVVNVMSAAHGETGLAFGNLVGACQLNLGFVLAMTAMIRPLQVEPSVVTREIPMLLLTVTALLVMSNEKLLSGADANALDRNDGLILLLLFGVFLYYTILTLARRRSDAFVEEIQEAVERVKDRPLWIDILMTVGGLVGVGIGGRMTVTGAIGVAEAIGVPEVIIGLTLVSFGTTLPELTTSIIAVRRGQSDIAMGNVVGSCIYNILCIGGVVATIFPIQIPAGGQIDLLMLTGLSAVVLPFALRGPMQITRAEGAVLFFGYLAYAVYRATSALAGSSVL